MLKKIIIFSLFNIVLWSANINDLIAKLHQVPISKRYKIMNQIKKELAKLNSNQRIKALTKLQAAMHKKINKTHFYKNHLYNFQTKPSKTKPNMSHNKPNSPHTIPFTHMPNKPKIPQQIPKPQHINPIKKPPKPMHQPKTPHMPNRTHHEVLPMHQPNHIHKLP